MENKETIAGPFYILDWCSLVTLYLRRRKENFMFCVIINCCTTVLFKLAIPTCPCCINLQFVDYSQLATAVYWTILSLNIDRKSLHCSPVYNTSRLICITYLDAVLLRNFIKRSISTKQISTLYCKKHAANCASHSTESRESHRRALYLWSVNG